MKTHYIHVSPILNLRILIGVILLHKVHQLRLIKSDEEIMFLRKGAEFSDLAIEALEHDYCNPAQYYYHRRTHGRSSR
jgi:Xaa-Pro aminopeptidase